MDIKKRKEQFNIAYLFAMAAHAGLNTGTMTVDDDSIDLLLHGRGYIGSKVRNRLQGPDG